ncbi:MAG: hypothetical protein CVT88_08255 [Candidatus Altiarchaeales archaeon HGW-Altiarchaeales-1]|nr:MAG: hypothetical protein CVT89_06885 [Candidatus Altiarchaeales archaeon HGW-Altiarchaeales-2]PKP57881.1 MAG: hypothetical protein CVT88_08255 [Candidatus Altiarchaeales archaeon HGW-Altiarchaeales-1]
MKVKNINITSIFGILFGIILFALLTNAFLNAEDKCATCKISEISANGLALNLFGNFLLPFEALALLLTAAVIGAIILAFKENNKEKIK